jgi:hypothetical protein
MKTVLLAAGAAALAVSAGQALANTHHKHAKGATAAAAGPKQPIPYAQLNAYLKASPSARAKKDWWSGESAVASNASAGATGANASATTPSAATPSETSAPAATPTPPPPADTPPASSAPPPSSDTTPPK